MKRIDLTGKIFGFLIVESFHSSGKKAKWNCICSCGNQCIAISDKLLGGRKTSCGCRTGQDVIVKTIGRVRYIYERNAKERGIDFNLNDIDIQELIFKNCDYCGSPPSNNIKGLPYSGIDRINNEETYYKENCIPCCRDCNLMKRDLTQEKFLLHIEKICQYKKL